MNTIRFVCTALLASTLACAPAFAQKKGELEEAMGFDGLKKIEVKGLDLAYARPGESLAAYSKLMVEPVEVAFHRNWDPTRTGSRLKLSADERENIRTGVAKIVHEEFVKVLQAKGNYKVVKEAGPDVLRVKPRIMNLYVNAPDTASAGRSRTYTVSAGEMTLFMELYDSETGAVLARVVDRRESRNTGMMQLSGSVFNAAEAQLIASAWARILRDALDRAHGVGKKK